MSDAPVTPGAQRLALAVSVGVGAVIVAWWPLTDRLDLPKQSGLVLVGTLVAAVALAHGRHRAGRSVVAIGLTLLGLGLALPEEMAARVEGIGTWVGALLLGWAAARARPEPIRRLLAWVGAGVGAVAVLQGLGLPLFGGTRVVAGTLGGPAHLGWTLALLLPWCRSAGPRAAPWVAAMIAAGLVLSGSRTGWVMAVIGLPFWVGGGSGPRSRACGGLLAGMVLALLVEGATGARGLEHRVADVGGATGTAAGRAYLWRMYLGSPELWAGAGHGPEGFVRAFPGVQRAWLEAHPEDRPFLSDLRHAHVDGIEVGADLGWLGLGLLVWLLVRTVRAGPARDPDLGVVAAGVVGGLASPVLFFPATAAVLAAAVGVRGGAWESTTARQPAGGIFPLLLASLLVSAWLARRTASEVVRSEATWLRLEGATDRARQRAERATVLDPRNPRAWSELAMSCEGLGERACACVAWHAVREDLPLDSVLGRCQ